MLTYAQIEALDADTLFEIELASVGPGWHSLMRECHSRLREEAPNYKPVQFKAKFGSLRYYVQGVKLDSPAYQAIRDAESKAAKTCEDCGAQGTVRSVGGWSAVLCASDEEIQIKRNHERMQQWTGA